MSRNKSERKHYAFYTKEGMFLISVGIDVSKGKSTVCIMKPGGEVLEPPFEVMHTTECVDALLRLIKTYDEESRVVLEETGHYHWPIATMLSEMVYSSARLMP